MFPWQGVFHVQWKTVYIIDGCCHRKSLVMGITLNTQWDRDLCSVESMAFNKMKLFSSLWTDVQLVDFIGMLATLKGLETVLKRIITC